MIEKYGVVLGILKVVVLSIGFMNNDQVVFSL